MPRQYEWSELRGGIIAAAAIAGVVLLTLLFARVGALHGKKVTLYVVTDDATGVLPGTEVWLGGKKEGLVKSVSFRPPSTDTSERVIIATDFLKEAFADVRRDSYAHIHPGGSLIGAVIVNIAPGTASSPPLHDGDTVRARANATIANLSEQISNVAPEVSALATEVSRLTTKISRPEGTIGNFRAHGLPNMAGLGAGMSRITARATNGNGTVGLAMHTDLMGRASRAMAGADSIRTLLSSNKGSFGRFQRDTTLVAKAQGVMAQVDTLRSLLANPVGSIAAAHSDTTLAQQLTQTHVLLDSLIKDVKAHPFRYISF
jgi:phospholipid/cholesterol/gamma-HCH transport system substrate-binding protein